MKSEHEVNDELIAKYLSGDASPDEAEAMADWLQEPANKIQFEQLEKTWNASALKAKPKFNPGRAWSRMESSIIPSQPTKSFSESAWWTTKTFRIAASFLLMTATAVILVLNFRSQEKYARVITQREIKSMTLPDSSEITLFRFSTIDYPQAFNSKTREVKFVKGEAFFRVAKDAQKPFFIHTPTANIKVVGTEFNVKVEGHQTEVAVKEGKVMVYALGDSVLLTVGANAVFTQGVKPKVTNDLIDNNVWSYATRRLVFKDTPLALVIADLQRTYPCTISIANKEIGNCKLTATFEKDSVDKILNLIAETLSLGVNRNGDVFVLAGEGCP